MKKSIFVLSIILVQVFATDAFGHCSANNHRHPHTLEGDETCTKSDTPTTKDLKQMLSDERALELSDTQSSLVMASNVKIICLEIETPEDDVFVETKLQNQIDDFRFASDRKVINASIDIGHNIMCAALTLE